MSKAAVMLASCADQVYTTLLMWLLYLGKMYGEMKSKRFHDAHMYMQLVLPGPWSYKRDYSLPHKLNRSVKQQPDFPLITQDV